MKVMQHKRAFTLIELLVVIAIIALLSAVVLSSLSTARTRARNAARAQTVQELVKAFALASDSGNAYPNTGGGWACISTTCGGAIGNSRIAAVDTALAPYITPPDPVKGSPSSLMSWGFDYNSNFAGATGPSGIVFPAGAYIFFAIEGTSCQTGQPWDNVNYISANYSICGYQLR